MFFPIRDDVPHRRTPVVNYLLIAANVALFFVQVNMGKAAYQYAAHPNEIVAGRHVFTILTSMFMHGSIMHLLSNMWFLYIFGDNVEDAFGHIAYFFVYLASGVCGTMLQVLMMPGSSTPMVGASGAISGVMGAYLLLYPRARVLTVVPVFLLSFISIPAVIYLGLWIGIQLLFGFSAPRAGGGTAFFAHIGGFGLGLVFGIVARIASRRTRFSYRIR
jgi:membrane associated rhomboid family serine protease